MRGVRLECPPRERKGDSMMCNTHFPGNGFPGNRDRVFGCAGLPRLLWATLGCAALLGTGCSAVSMQKELNWFKMENQSLLGDRNRLENQLAACEGEQEGLRKELARVLGELSTARRENESLRTAALDEEGVSLTPAMAPGEETGFEGIEGLSVDERANGEIHVTLEQSILFASGSARVTRKGRATLLKIGETLSSRFSARSLRVEGHTDNTPVKRSKNRYPTNWELSSSRASAVLAALIATKAVDPARCQVVGHAEQRPLASNDTEDGRRANRRVEVVILPRE